MTRIHCNSTPSSTLLFRNCNNATFVYTPKMMMTGVAILLFLLTTCLCIMIHSEIRQFHSIQYIRQWDASSSSISTKNNDSRGLGEQTTDIILPPNKKSQSQIIIPTQEGLTLTNDEDVPPLETITKYNANPYALSPGELPGYTGWARPEQTLAGYFDIAPLSHRLPLDDYLSSMKKHYATIQSGELFSLLLTCNHNRTNNNNNNYNIDMDDDEEEIDEAPPYECPPTGGALFFVRAYGPSVITGIVRDFYNSSYSVELQFIDPGIYTLEVVLTFSVPMEFDEFPLNAGDATEVEPGYEGYMVSGFPLSILVEESSLKKYAGASEGNRKPWCTLYQLTDSSPTSALYNGHWRVVDHVARLSHQPLTHDEIDVTIDGYRMGLNSIGVRMTYEYEECELIHIRELVGVIHRGMNTCLEAQLGFKFHDGKVDRNESDTYNNVTSRQFIGDENQRRHSELGVNNSDDGLISTEAISSFNETRIGFSELTADKRVHYDIHPSDALSSNENKFDENILAKTDSRMEDTQNAGNGIDIREVNATSFVGNITHDVMAGEASRIIPTTNTVTGVWESSGRLGNNPINVTVKRSDEYQQAANDNEYDHFIGIHVIFIGDSVMKLVTSFFYKLVERSSGFRVTFIETNGGIHLTMKNVTFALEEIQRQEKFREVKRAVIFNSGLHDIDVLCSSKRSRSRRMQNIIKEGESCVDAYRNAMIDLIHVLNEFPAELKVFRSTTAGWQKYGNYGFQWPANKMQPMSRSPHFAYHFNTIVYDIIEKESSNILIMDGFWLTLPRPDHTQVSAENEVGKHLVHPGMEVLSVFARSWLMLILLKLCGDMFEDCMSCIIEESEL